MVTAFGFNAGARGGKPVGKSPKESRLTPILFAKGDDLLKKTRWGSAIVLHRHYAFDNTGPRGCCKPDQRPREAGARLARLGRLARRQRHRDELRAAHDLKLKISSR